MQPVEDIGKISPRPVFIVQGLSDAAIPGDSAQRLYDAAGEPRSLWVGENVPHLGMYARYGSEYARRLIDFFDRSLGKP
jgi:fermentation-respiration switch protein FrsA (DUF1100 family)